MRRAWWCLGVRHGAGAAALQVPNACEIVWYAPEVSSTGSRYPGSYRFEVLGGVQDFRWSQELGSVREFPKKTKPCTLPCLPGRKLCPVAPLAGKQVMPCSSFAGQEIGCARIHGFEMPQNSHLSEISSFFLRHRAPASRVLSTQDHQNEFTGQSPRYGALGMKQTLYTDACGFWLHRRAARLYSLHRLALCA